MKNIQLYIFLLLFPYAICICQEPAQTHPETKIVVIAILDGTEIIGIIQKETESTYSVKSPAGLLTEIPKTSVAKISTFEGKIINGKIYFPDPNKSMYLFAPSAFPIGHNKSYCRDFCLFFPSYNRGLTNTVSLQAGAFVFPGADFSTTPIVLSGKISLPPIGQTQIAGGVMYISFPAQSDVSFGGGFAFGTATLGNRFSHLSSSLGWGFFQVENRWEFQSEPIIVLSGNYRISNSIAFVGEWWRFPGSDLGETPFMISGRFIGRKIAVDIGVITTLHSVGFGIPLLNFTYHFH